MLLLLAFSAAVSALSHFQQNGRSTWGILNNKDLVDILPDSGDIGFWSSWQTRQGYSGASPPFTGKTRYYNWTVSRGVMAPDGVPKPGIFVNGQFPGPLVEANWGDMVSVTINNNITGPEEGTAMHWHGMAQKGTQWMDGTPGVSHCPISPGQSFTYTFQADKFGSTWWHAHYSAQWSAGLYGPLIIHGPKIDKYDVDVGPLMLGDWYHRDYHSVVGDSVANTDDFHTYVPASDNSLINGKNNFNCSLNLRGQTCDPSAGFSKFRFQSGKTYRLRLMNVGSAGLVHFSIDNHTMQVISTDMTPTVPYYSEVVTLHVGQRTDVLVKAKDVPIPEKAYWIRSTLAPNCSETQHGNGLGVLLYNDVSDSVTPNTQVGAAAAYKDLKLTMCSNDPLNQTVPRIPMSVPTPDVTETIVVNLFRNSTGSNVWLLNNETQYTNYNEPALLMAINNKTTAFPPRAQIHNFGNKRNIRIVMYTPYQAPHPMHLHGHDYQVLAEGLGTWDGTIVNPSNPLRRDTHIMRRFGYLVIQFQADNPGVWAYHCHIAWHASMGYNYMILERPEDLRRQSVPKDVSDLCRKWEAFSSGNVVDQIDSGI